MTSISHGQRVGRIISRSEKTSPKAYVYRLLLDDGTTASVEERTTLSRNINDEYIIAVYDDPFYNVFIERK